MHAQNIRGLSYVVDKVPGAAQVVFTLQQQAQIEPGFTQLVWQKLEEQNPDFFRAYYTRLKLKDQIVLFNHLLEQQVAMFQKMQRQWMAPSGRSHVTSAQHSRCKVYSRRPPWKGAQMHIQRATLCQEQSGTNHVNGEPGGGPTILTQTGTAPRSAV